MKQTNAKQIYENINAYFSFQTTKGKVFLQRAHTLHVLYSSFYVQKKYVKMFVSDNYLYQNNLF